MILIWRESTKPDDYTHGKLENYMELTEEFVVDNCKPFPGTFPDSTLIITTSAPPTDFFFAGPMFIVSELLCEILKAFHTTAEFFEVHTVLNREREKLNKRFYFVNILDSVDCFDFDNSTYRATETGVREIEHLALHEDKAKGHSLFLIGPVPAKNKKNSRVIKPIITCASEELATGIIESGCTGVAFVKSEHWRDYPALNVAWKP